ncbi:MAG TPA: hypothetical protein VL588_02285 [Bdellovibrionota bacterium]|nr:hypothetical protein [Bdellovibrionota bacterium]
MKRALVLLSLVISTAAMANGPHPIPGGPAAVSAKGLGVLSVVLGNLESLKEARKYGDQVLAVSAKTYTENTRYVVLVGTCTVDPAYICMGKATLTITRGFIPGHGTTNTAEVKELDGGLGSDKLPNALKDSTAAVVEALSNVPTDAQALSAHGNKVTKASSQFISPWFSRYSVTIRQCNGFTGMHCTSGATLGIEASSTHEGPMTHTTYTSTLSVLEN